MAEGVFSITADIVPVLDERQLQTQAQNLVKQFNSLLAKEVKPIQLTANTKSLEQSQTVLSKITTQTSAVVNGFEAITKSAVNLAAKGIRPIANAFENLVPTVTKVFQTISAAGGKAFDTARVGVLKFTDAINSTNSRIVGFSGSIRQAIADNTRFKSGLDLIKRSGDALKTLPDTFANIQAQVIAGVSPLQRAAAAGSSTARALVPLLLLGVSVSRELGNIGGNIRALVTDSGSLAEQFVAVPKRVQAAFASFGKDAPAAKKAVEELRTAIPGLSGQLDKLVISSRGKGIGELKAGMKDLRDEFIKTELGGDGLKGVIKRLFSATDFTQAKAQLEELNRALIGLGGKEDVPFFKRFNITASDSFSKVEELIRRVEPKLVDIATRVASLGSAAAVQGTASIKSSGVLPTTPRQPVQQSLLSQATPTTVTATAQATGQAAGKAMAAGLTDTKSDFLFFFKTAFGPAAVKPAIESTLPLFEEEGKKIASAVEKGATAKKIQIFNPNSVKLLAGGGQAAFQAAAGDAAKIFQGDFERRLTGLAGKVSITDALGINAANIGKGLDKIQAPVNRLKTTFSGLGDIIKAPFRVFQGVVGESLGGLGGLATGGLGAAAAITAIGAASLRTAAQFETYRIAFEGLFGPGQGDKVIALALDFDKLTHFDLQTTVGSIEQLAGAIQNIQPSGAIAVLKQLAGAAAAVGAGGEVVQRVVLAFTQISAAGKLTAQDLNQISQAIPAISRTNVYAQIAKDLGVTNQKAKQLAADGLVDSRTALSAVLKVAHDIPGAATAMEKQSQSFKGLLTIVGNELTRQVLIPLGTKLLPLAKLVLDSIINLFEKLGPALNSAGKAIGGFFNDLANAPVIGSLVKRVMDNLGESMKGAGDNAQASTAGLSEAQAALDVLKNTAQKFHTQADAVTHSLALFAAQARLTGQSTAGFQKTANDISILGAAFDSLANTKDFGALQSGIGQIDKLLKGVTLSPELMRTVNDFKDAANNAVAAQQSHIHDILQKVLQEQDAFKAQAAAQKAVTKAQQDYDDLLATTHKDLETKHIQLTKDLTAANSQLTDANTKLTDAQNALNEAQKPAAVDEMQKAEDNLASARLRVRQILEDEKNAQDALNNTNRKGIDLTGLSIDQINSRLKLARAALASQKAADQKSNIKSTEQTSIDTATHQIDKTEAAIAVRDAEKQVLDLKQKGSALDPAVIAAKLTVTQATKDQLAATEKTQEVQTSLNSLESESATFNQAISEAKKNGVISQATLNKLAGEDLGLVRQIQSSQDGITSAKEAQKAADQAAQEATATAAGDQDKVNKILYDRIDHADPRLQSALDTATSSLSDHLSIQQLMTGEVGNTSTAVEKLIGLLNQTSGKVPQAPDVNALGDQINKKALSDQAQKLLDPLKGHATLVLNGEKVTVDKDGVLHWPDGSVGTVDMLTIKELADFLVQATPFKNAGSGVIASIAGKLVQDPFGNIADLGKFQSNPAVQQALADPTIANRLLQVLPTTGGDVHKALQLIFRHLKISVPGFAAGGVFAKETLGRFGEAGIEAILPLTRPARLQDILSHPSVLPPVLNALDRISLPGGSSGMETNDSFTDLSGIRMVRSGPQIPDHHVQAKRDAALAKAIVAEMKDAGMSMGQTIVNNEFVAPDGNDPLAKIHAAQIAREVKRQIEKLL